MSKATIGLIDFFSTRRLLYSQVFEPDTDRTRLVSPSNTTTLSSGNNSSALPVISGDGRFVAFTSTAANLAGIDSDTKQDVFRRAVVQLSPVLETTGLPQTFQFDEAAYMANETGGTVTVNVTRDAAFVNAAMSVAYATGGGTASPGNDCTAASGVLNFVQGQSSKSIVITLNNDSQTEGDETFNLTLSNPIGGATLGTPSTTSVTIEDDESLPKLSIADTAVFEPRTGTTKASFTVALSAASTQNVTVAFATSDGTAGAAADYTQTSGSLTFAPGERSKTIEVVVKGDTSVKHGEFFFVSLSNPAHAVIFDGLAACTVADGSVLISEFRFRGVGLSGDGALDEFIEIYNGTILEDSALPGSTIGGGLNSILSS